MEPQRQFARPRVPFAWLLFSSVAVAIPAVGTLFLAGVLGDYEPLLWLLALVPAFLLAYSRGWRGVAAAMGLALGFLFLVQMAATALGRSPDRGPLFIGVLLAFVGTGIGVAVLAELIHRERSRAEAAALTDALTGIPNRRYAELVLPLEFAGAQRGRELSIVLFDLDRFKGYNDRHGHAAGDEALRQFAAVLQDNTRAMNLSARWGGEEFIAILSSTSDTGAVVFAQRVRHALSRTPPLAGPLTVTAGVAQYAAGMSSPIDLLEAADQALYQAKRAGRDGVAVYRPERGSQASPPAPA